MHLKYQNSYYWENLVRSRKLIETFNNVPITKDSVFFQGIIYNSFGRRKLLEDVLHFSSLDALSGYLQYVFLPTAFMSFTNEEKGIIVPLGLSLEDLIGYLAYNDFVQYHNYLHIATYIKNNLQKSCAELLTKTFQTIILKTEVA